MNIKGILPMYETWRGFCGIAVGDSILLTSSASSSEMHYCHIAPVETYTSTLNSIDHIIIGKGKQPNIGCSNFGVEGFLLFVFCGVVRCSVYVVVPVLPNREAEIPKVSHRRAGAAKYM
jgi:hypothetical protein